MTLTNSQLIVLRDDILADPVLDALPNTPDGAFAIAAAYSLQAVPDFTVWRTRVETEEIKQVTVWTEYTGRSAGERDAFRFMLQDGYINVADPNIQQGFQDIFSGAGGATTRAQLVAIAKRLATRAEKLFSAGTGSDADPATMTFEGNLLFKDVQAARAA